MNDLSFPNWRLQSGRLSQFLPLLLAMLLLLPDGVAASSSLRGFRVVHQDNLLIYVDLDSKPADTRIFLLSDPSRLVIDLAETTLDAQLPVDKYAEGVVQQVRSGIRDQQHLRVVLDLRSAVSPSYQYVSRQDGQRLVVDLGVKGNPLLADIASQQFDQPVKSAKSVGEPLRNLVVAIDAGHGGEDPGALGSRKTKEKDITLSIATRLYKRLKGEKGVTPVLVRSKDEFIALRERILIARRMKADLFLSIHADAVPRKTAVGSSVYALSLKGASSETAQWLADNEKNADLFGDVALEGYSRDLQQTLIELAQNTTIESSMELGQSVLAQLGDIGPLHKETVELANFAVLKSPDIPSVLVETAFISNSGEEKKLRSARFQERLARALQIGIMNYLYQRAPAGSILAARRSASSG